MDREKVIKELKETEIMLKQAVDRGGEMSVIGAFYCLNRVTNTLALLKEHELPTELKQKMWNALYAEEDEYEKKFIGKEEHLNWFTVYRPWLQKGFDIAINAIANWEGR